MINSFDELKVGDLIKFDMLWGINEYLGRDDNGTVLLKNIAGELNYFNPELLEYTTIVTDGWTKQEYWERRKELEEMLEERRKEFGLVRKNCKAE